MEILLPIATSLVVLFFCTILPLWLLAWAAIKSIRFFWLIRDDDRSESQRIADETTMRNTSFMTGNHQ